MKNLSRYLQKAKTSPVHLWLLNHVLWRVIPFNRPHRLWVRKLTDYQLEIALPYRRKNMNHLRGLHACALATAAEYASGLLLISHLDPARYRLIMQRMELDYHYQGKSDGVARFELDEKWLEDAVRTPLQSVEKIVVTPEVNVYDAEAHHLLTARVHWQIKRWDKVKTAV